MSSCFKVVVERIKTKHFWKNTDWNINPVKQLFGTCIYWRQVGIVTLIETLCCCMNDSHLTLWAMVWMLWLGDALLKVLEAGEPADPVCGDEELKPLFVGDGTAGLWWCLGAGTGCPKWLLHGVEGREFVGVRQLADDDSRCWTIFWQAAIDI